MTNPFDDAARLYLALMNDEQQYSLWPADLDVPAGWSSAYGPVERSDCLEYIEAQWTDLRPASIRQ